MRIRELTQRPIVEFVPAWALLDLVFGASPQDNIQIDHPLLVYLDYREIPSIKIQLIV